MIKFFRKIRYDLMEKNKTGKYLKYAIGEIILVMIGILLALQINNWNQQKTNKKVLEQFLVEYKEELRFNIKDLKRDLKTIASQKEIKDKLLKNKRLDTIPLDSLEKHLETVWLKVGYSPTLLRRFENAQITNYEELDSIYFSLLEFYGFLWPEFMELKNTHNSEVNKQGEYWRYQQNSYELKLINGDKAFINDSAERKKELIKLLKSPLARNILKVDYRSKNNFKGMIERLIGMAENYLKQINEILDDKIL
jgi:hypothetical protein